MLAAHIGLISVYSTNNYSMSTFITHYRAPRLTKERRTVGSQYSVNDITGMLLYSCDNCIQCHPVRYTVSERILIVVRPIPGLSLSHSQLRDIRFLSIQMTSPCSHVCIWRVADADADADHDNDDPSRQKTTIRYDTHVYSASIHLDALRIQDVWIARLYEMHR